MAGEDEGRVEGGSVDCWQECGVSWLWWNTEQWLLKKAKIKSPRDATPPILSECPRDLKEAFAHVTSRNAFPWMEK